MNTEQIKEEFKKIASINSPHLSEHGVNSITDWWLEKVRLSRQEGVREAREKIEKLKMSEKGVITIEMGNGHIHKIEGETDKTLIYNQALSDVLASLSNTENNEK